MAKVKIPTMAPFVASGTMNNVTILPAPEIGSTVAEESPWERERRAFVQLLPSLLETHPGQYAAVRNGTVVASGSDRIGVALDAYRQVGYVPLYVGLVGEVPRRRVRLPSPRVFRRATSA
jgi:hypothetical protein